MDVVTALELSRQTIKNIKQNLFGHLVTMCWEFRLRWRVLHLFGGPSLTR